MKYIIKYERRDVIEVADDYELAEGEVFVEKPVVEGEEVEPVDEVEPEVKE